MNVMRSNLFSRRNQSVWLRRCLQGKLIPCILLLGMLMGSSLGYAQDTNFHIYLCFGQSNMEGNARIEGGDTIVNDRFQVLSTVNCPALNREMGQWYTATSPLCRCRTGIGPADYFGRKMVEALPANIRVGVINVSVGGCKIELFDKDGYASYVNTAPDWLKNMVKEYDGNPYARLVEMAKLAQHSGVIKGVLLHQGESNTGDTTWPSKVKKVYDNLLQDLNLPAGSLPLLAGEVVNADQGGVCASMNRIIGTLPRWIPSAHIISSAGCSDATDNLHFNIPGYRELGERYARQMLDLLGYSHAQ